MLCCQSHQWALRVVLKKNHYQGPVCGPSKCTALEFGVVLCAVLRPVFPQCPHQQGTQAAGHGRRRWRRAHGLAQLLACACQIGGLPVAPWAPAGLKLTGTCLIRRVVTPCCFQTARNEDTYCKCNAKNATCNYFVREEEKTAVCPPSLVPECKRAAAERKHCCCLIPLRRTD